jgi:ubiquinone/menaquinone biosynthesis C-methylase UbiE
MSKSRFRARKTPTLIINQNCFDFIHFRGVAQGIAKWPDVLKDAYRCLTPGGYVELSELSSKFSSFPSVTVCLSIPAVRRCGIESEEILSKKAGQGQPNGFLGGRSATAQIDE